MKVLLNITDTLHFRLPIEVPDGTTHAEIKRKFDAGELEINMDDAYHFEDESKLGEIID